MNKTVKTIAWICLVLGLLGVAVDVGLYIKSRSIAAQMQEAIESGELPGFKGRFSETDGDGDYNKEDLDDNDISPEGQKPLDGQHILNKSKSGGFLSNGLHDGKFNRIGFGLPIIIFISGPVLTIIGAVTLIVNREPKLTDVKSKKAKTKKS